MATTLEIYPAYQQCLQARDYAGLGEVADVQGYTENCLGLTGWTTGSEVALQNYARNILGPFTDLQYTTIDVIVGADALSMHNRVEATHTSTFLGIPATGRRIAWDLVFMVNFAEGRMVGQWIQFDLCGIYQQLTSPTPETFTTRAAQPPRAWAQSAR